VVTSLHNRAFDRVRHAACSMGRPPINQLGGEILPKMA
jgi:hypothetical protein